MGKILFTGGSGLLGEELQKLISDGFYPGHADFDITDLQSMEKYIDGKDIATIFHAAAFTSPPKIDQNPLLALETNIGGTVNVTKLCIKHNIKMIYVSTDYVFRGDQGNYMEEDPVYPVNKYAWSKLGGECAVRMYDNSLIIRTSFGPNEFPYDKAFVDQWTSREKVSIIAELIARLIKKDSIGIFHVGGERKTVFEYAEKVSPDKIIGKISVNEVTFKVPQDTSLNSNKLKKLLNN